MELEQIHVLRPGEELVFMRNGRVSPGGADYQVIVDGFSLDARYTLSRRSH